MLKGAPRRLTVLDYGLFRVNAGRTIGICGYLIETDAGERVLVDTGFPQKYADDGARAAEEDLLGAFGKVLVCGPENMPAGQLATMGLGTGDIALLVMTHTHIDHVGHLDGFPGVPIVIGAAERALPKPLYWGDVRPMDWPDAEYREIDADTVIGPGLTLISAPGHAPGQLSLLVELPETGAVLLTGDAISRPAEVAEGFAGTADRETAVASAARLMEIAAEREAFVIYGHDPAQWSTLRKAPDSYH